LGVGAPERLLDELVRQRKSNLFVIADKTAEVLLLDMQMA
jgi:hypothetical protein